MLFADDTVLCSTRKERLERKLGEWRRAMEERGLKISRKKTEYLSALNIKTQIFIYRERQ